MLAHGRLVTGEGLDNVVTAETPEGILLELRPAGLSARAVAFVADGCVRLGILYAVAIVAALLGSGVGIALVLISSFALIWLYPLFFELAVGGATPGKRMVGLRVVMDDGLPVTPGASLIRSVLQVADFLPFAFAGGIATILLRHDCKRLGDLAADTLVVHQPPRHRHPILHDVFPLVPAMPLRPRDQAAVVALATRAPRLTVERLDELSALAAAVSGDAGRSGPEVTRRVLGVAQWLLGRRA